MSGNKKKEKKYPGRSPVYYIIEQGKDIIVKEKEGRTKSGDFSQQRVCRFSSPGNVIIYLKQKYGEKV